MRNGSASWERCWNDAGSSYPLQPVATFGDIQDGINNGKFLSFRNLPCQESSTISTSVCSPLSLTH
jgi:hypothetical protein